MSLAGSDIIAAAQRECLDTGVTSATAGDYLQWLADGVNEIFTRRPDFRLQADGTLADVSTSTIGLPADWFGPLVKYIVYRFRSRMDPDANQPSAADALKFFFSKLGA